jgi:hypothetical protein
MDKFTQKTNSILKDFIVKEAEERVIYSSEEDAEAPVEDPATKNIMDQIKAAKPAIEVARQLAMKAQGGLFNDPQKKMNKSYGDLMNKIATKISSIKI